MITYGNGIFDVHAILVTLPLRHQQVFLTATRARPFLSLPSARK